MPTETDLWNLAAPNMRGPQFTRIESVTSVGQSDVHGLYQGVDIWIELKIFHGNIIDFRKSEISWITRRIMLGGRVWILARKTTKSEDALYLYRGSDIPALLANGVISIEGKRQGILKAPLTICSWGSVWLSPFNWEALKERMFFGWSKQHTPDSRGIQ